MIADLPSKSAQDEEYDFGRPVIFVQLPVKGSERYERVVQRMVELSDRGVIFGDTALDIALAALREEE